MTVGHFFALADVATGAKRVISLALLLASELISRRMSMVAKTGLYRELPNIFAHAGR
jgi:hypothetical protein